jgi:hypothetical protein
MCDLFAQTASESFSAKKERDRAKQRLKQACTHVATPLLHFYRELRAGVGIEDTEG